ncbi:MAG: GNAT family N-acetyltransferase [Oscillospiraceae bacterium]
MMKLSKNRGVGAMTQGFTIEDYRPENKPDLLAISLPWLEGNDILEPADFEMLENPEAMLAGGGRIFIAHCEGKAVGMMMLELEADGHGDALKFGVLEAYQNRGIGKALMEKTIEAARSLGCKKIVLTSCHQLHAALHVYEKFGFRQVPHVGSHFELSDIMMALDL